MPAVTSRNAGSESSAFTDESARGGGGGGALLPKRLDVGGPLTLDAPVSFDSTPSRSPAWLRSLGWLIFVLWTVVAGLMVARWWLRKGAHGRAQAMVAAGRAVPAPRAPGGGGGGRVAAMPEAAGPRGTPAGELPLIGPILSGDESAATELRMTLGALTDAQLAEVPSLMGQDNALAKSSDSWFDSFYFMYADSSGLTSYGKIPQ